MFRRHGLTKGLKRRVFDALLERQQGKCFICEISQTELEAKHLALPVGARGHAPSRWRLHIDHCHTTGMIRGLLCERCNIMLGRVENYGVGVEEGYRPPEEQGNVLYARMIEETNAWLERNRAIIYVYMQSERWTPRKDILFHLKV